MELKELIKSIAVEKTFGKMDVSIRKAHFDSRQVGKGDVFVAMRGENVDGHKFIAKAIEQGAAGIIAEQAPATVNLEIGWVQTADSRAALGPIAAKLEGDPSLDLKVCGITGTNGKTTTTFLIQHLLNAAQRPCGVIGTVSYGTGEAKVEANRTTPEGSEIQRLLAEMRESGCRAGVMEVSSIGLVMHRVAGVQFDVGVFTNLSQDHLDFHKTMENYYQAKKSFVTLLENQASDKKPVMVVNLDDSAGERMTKNSYDYVNFVTYGMGARSDFRASNIKTDLTGTTFQLDAKGRQFMVRMPLIGRFNISNALAALTAVTNMGLNLREAVQNLADAPQVPGRLESVDSKMPFRVFVDYAHTPDALEKACATLQELNPNRLVTVFGCGGDRDRSKRALMAKAASVHSDAVVITSDNPRTEDPQQILRDTEEGLQPGTQSATIEDRKEAIRQAIFDAKPRDIVLIAGKGHETYQEFADGKIDFDDRLVAQHAINDLRQERFKEDSEES